MEGILSGIGLNLIKDKNLIVGIIVVLLLIVIFFRLLHKSGLFLLTLTFIVDKFISYLPINLYKLYPKLRSYIDIFYILALAVFIIKIARLFKRRKDRNKDKNNGFFAFTGSGPFILMLLVNVLATYLNFESVWISYLTSISFLYMLIKSLVNVGKMLKDKGIGIDSFDFDLPQEGESINSNEGRLKKNFDSPFYEGPPFDADRVFDLITKAGEENKASMNETYLTITDLVSGERRKIESKKVLSELSGKDFYRLKLNFKDGEDFKAFSALARKYRKDKGNYKFKLSLKPTDRGKARLVFYDPDEVKINMFSREIILSFKKHKLNLVEEN